MGRVRGPHHRGAARGQRSLDRRQPELAGSGDEQPALRARPPRGGRAARRRRGRGRRSQRRHPPAGEPAADGEGRDRRSRHRPRLQGVQPNGEGLGQRAGPGGGRAGSGGARLARARPAAAGHPQPLRRARLARAGSAARAAARRAGFRLVGLAGARGLGQRGRGRPAGQRGRHRGLRGLQQHEALQRVPERAQHLQQAVQPASARRPAAATAPAGCRPRRPLARWPSPAAWARASRRWPPSSSLPPRLAGTSWAIAAPRTTCSAHPPSSGSAPPAPFDSSGVTPGFDRAAGQRGSRHRGRRARRGADRRAHAAGLLAARPPGGGAFYPASDLPGPRRRAARRTVHPRHRPAGRPAVLSLGAAPVAVRAHAAGIGQGGAAHGRAPAAGQGAHGPPPQRAAGDAARHPLGRDPPRHGLLPLPGGGGAGRTSST